jgi:uncharacterized protein (DUF433 family)
MAVLYNNIQVEADGVAWIQGTRVKVVEVAIEHLAHGWSAEEIHRQHPDLPKARIYEALAFYYDNQAEFDEQISQTLASTDESWLKNSNSPGRQKLRALGLLH